MKLHAVFVYISFTNILFVCAKIHGGPRGRFDNQPKAAPHVNSHVAAHHNHFTYHPPNHINFICRYCTTVTSYPVYHGLPPTYVYKFRESNSRFGALLTGLALYNLGRAAEYWHHTHTYYNRRPDEECSLQVIDPAHFEETQFPCFMMSSFLAQSKTQGSDSLDITSAQVNIKPYLRSTGSPIEVTRDQECVIWHNTTLNKEKTVIPCVLLKEYSNTMKPSGLPVYVWLPVTLGVVVAISICCQSCCKKKKNIFDEEAPLNQNHIVLG